MASYALCLMRMNGIENIWAFCDNDRGKWGVVITNRVHSESIREQLREQGIEEERIFAYKLPLLPMESTNYFMRNL